MSDQSQQFNLIATSSFGLEAVVSRELKELGYENLDVQDGAIRFQGDARAICRANLWLRSADRVLVEVGQFPAEDFGALFDQTTELPWENWISKESEFHVKGKSIKSTLHSTPHCQSITKKAIAERLKNIYDTEWLEETGEKVTVQCALKKDIASLTVDTSGAGLHKRGYRKMMGKAPLRETLAAALIQLSYWNKDRLLFDPMCGTGTIPIEAAMIARNMAPGLQRAFASENWELVPTSIWMEERARAREMIEPNLKTKIQGSDQDLKCIHMCENHSYAAGVQEDIEFEQGAVEYFSSRRDYGCLITNPPYGERLGDVEEAEALYQLMGNRFRKLDNWSHYILASHEKFETFYGQRADRRRKLYNGAIACTYFQYQGPKPPWNN